VPGDECTGSSDDQREPLIDRRVDLTDIPLHLVGWFAVLVVGIGTRLFGRDNWPLSPDESAIARDAWALLHGNDLSSGADAHPVTVQVTTFLMFLFGDTDFTVRLVPLLAGMGIIWTLYWCRTWLGNLHALSIAALWSLSPTMTMSTLRLDGGQLLILTVVLILALTLSPTVNASLSRSIALGISIAVAIGAHPLGWIMVPFAFIPALLIVRDIRSRIQLLPVAGAMAGTLLVFSSWFLSRPGSVLNFFSESISTLWSEHLASL
jgi:4-amino-4-deoxy-L-arabinose transferase-like glycosyltransferase